MLEQTGYRHRAGRAAQKELNADQESAGRQRHVPGAETVQMWLGNERVSYRRQYKLLKNYSSEYTWRK